MSNRSDPVDPIDFVGRDKAEAATILAHHQKHLAFRRYAPVDELYASALHVQRGMVRVGCVASSLSTSCAGEYPEQAHDGGDSLTLIPDLTLASVLG